MRPKTNSTHSGFTLIEILVALFVFTIVSMLMTTALHSLLRSEAAVEKNAGHFAELQTALLLLSRDIAQAIDRPSLASGSHEAFQGTDGSIMFTHTGLANPDGALQRPTLQRTRYVYTGSRLSRLTWPLPDSTAKTAPDERILLGQLTHFAFSYMDKNNRFHNHWPVMEEKSALPRAVRVRFTLENMGTIEQLYPVEGQSLHE